MSTSPFLIWLAATSANASGPKHTRPDAVAARAVGALPPTSTIAARPALPQTRHRATEGFEDWLGMEVG